MSLLDIVTKGVPKLAPVPDGEYQIRIVGVGEPEEKESKKTGHKFDMVNFVIEIEGEPTADTIYHTIFGPMKIKNPTPMEEKNNIRSLNRIADFLEGFGFDREGDFPEKEEFIGQTANVNLIYKTDAYGPKNEIKKFMGGI